MKKHKAYNIAFFGTSEMAVAVLDELKEAGFIPTIIVTAPDKPRGRGLKQTPSPVKVWAEKNFVDILQPANLSNREFLSELRNSEWDLFVVAAYGKLLPKAILDIPTHGVLNVHPSLLPRLRGASPIISAILTDEKKTGVTIMLLDEKLDHGPLVAQASVEIDEWPPKASLLRDILAHEGGKLLAEVISEWMSGAITPEPQDESKATYTKKITKEAGRLNLSSPPYETFRTIQALSENPGVYFFTKRNGKEIRLKVLDAIYKNGECVITRVVPEGKQAMSYDDFLRGQKGD